VSVEGELELPVEGDWDRPELEESAQEALELKEELLLAWALAWA
jgi:hypothetical protein